MDEQIGKFLGREPITALEIATRLYAHPEDVYQHLVRMYDDGRAQICVSGKRIHMSHPVRGWVSGPALNRTPQRAYSEVAV